MMQTTLWSAQTSGHYHVAPDVKKGSLWAGGWAFDMSTLPVWGLGRHVAYCCALFVTVCVMEVCGQIMGDTPSGLAKSLVQVC